MFCRRIFSCILLVIIVLSVTRTPIIASAATAVASNNIEALLSNQWKTLSPIFITLKEYFNESSEPLIQQLCNLLITRIRIITAPAEVSSPDDVQDFVTALTGFSSQIKRLLKLKHNSQVSITLNAKLFTRVILWLLIFPQNDRVNEIINELIRELKEPELVQEVMKYLTMAMTEDASDLSAPIWNLMNKLFFHAKKFGYPAGWLGTLFRISQYKQLSELQKKEAIDALTTLDSHVLSPDNAARIIPCLHFALKYTELSKEEKTEAIDALITLVTIVTSPDEAACIFFCLDFALKYEESNDSQWSDVIDMMQPLITNDISPDDAEYIILCLNFVLKYKELNKSQKNNIMNIMKKWDTDVISRDTAAWIIPCLDFVLKYENLNDSQWSDVIDIMKSLIKLVTEPDHAAWLILVLVKDLDCEKLNISHRDNIISMMKPLFEFAKNSDYWAEITNTLSQILENEILSSDQQKKIEDMMKM